MNLDLPLFYFLNNAAGDAGVVDALIVFFAQYLRYFLVLGFVLLWHFSDFEKKKKLRVFLVVTTSAIVARLGVTEFIRFLYHRPRPFVAYHVEQLIAENRWSFPSGHAALLFAMAMALYLYNKKWGIGFFIAACLVSIGRVAAGVHYPSDIIGGIAVGVGTAYTIFYLVEKKKIGGRYIQ